MNYDTFTSASLTASAFARRWMPRVCGLWVYTVAIVGLAIVWLGYRSYESGQLFREQFDCGWNHCYVLEATNEFIDRPLLPMPIKETTAMSEDIDVLSLVSELPWQRLRKLAKTVGCTSKTKAAILTALTEETDLDLLTKAYLEL